MGRSSSRSKGYTRFCTVSRIEAEASKLFGIIPSLDNLALPDLIQELANLFCELNLLHPFREGNGELYVFSLKNSYLSLATPSSGLKLLNKNGLMQILKGYHSI
ncbi:Fic family protein [Vibrio sp. 10N.261.52.C11]|uniref:Fic family protein n=1 Tax=unclassified Vibrio TaxID=2614977 RepID=UPI00355241C4